MEEAIKYLLDIGFDDAHLPELFNDDDKSTYTIPELMQAYTDHKLKLLGIADVTPRFSVSIVYQNQTANMLRTLVTDANSKEEALGKAIQYFNKETDGFGLILKSVTHLN